MLFLRLSSLFRMETLSSSSFVLYYCPFSLSYQSSEKFAFSLLYVALIMAFIPGNYILLFTILETFTRYSPPRKASTERWRRRLKEWCSGIAGCVETERDQRETATQVGEEKDYSNILLKQTIER